MPATTAAERLSSLGSRKVNRLLRSTSEVTFALPASLRKISRSASRFPVPEGLARPDLRRPVLDPALARDGGAAGPSAIAATAPPARLGQVAVEAVPPALRAVDVAVDGLVADRRPVLRLVPETPRDLLRRPAGLQAL